MLKNIRATFVPSHAGSPACEGTKVARPTPQTAVPVWSVINRVHLNTFKTEISWKKYCVYVPPGHHVAETISSIIIIIITRLLYFLQALDAQELSYLHLKVCRSWKSKLSKEEALQKRIDSLEMELINKQRNAQQHCKIFILHIWHVKWDQVLVI